MKKRKSQRVATAVLTLISIAAVLQGFNQMFLLSAIGAFMLAALRYPSICRIRKVARRNYKLKVNYVYHTAFAVVAAVYGIYNLLKVINLPLTTQEAIIKIFAAAALFFIVAAIRYTFSLRVSHQA